MPSFGTSLTTINNNQTNQTASEKILVVERYHDQQHKTLGLSDNSHKLQTISSIRQQEPILAFDCMDASSNVKLRRNSKENHYPNPFSLHTQKSATPVKQCENIEKDLMAILQSVLRKQPQSSKSAKQNSEGVQEKVEEEKRKYQMIFSSLEDILSKLNTEYNQKFNNDPSTRA